MSPQTKSPESPKPGVFVCVTGSGLTLDEANKNALRQAVEQVTGAFVEAETRIRNDQLISDKVLTLSRGFVSHYQELNRWEKDGVHFQKVYAKVETEKVASELVKHGVSVLPFDGRKLASVIITEQNLQKNAKEVLQRLWRDYPSGVLRGEIQGEPKPLKNSENDVTLSFDVLISIDPDKYRKFLAKTQPVLELVAAAQELVASARQQERKTQGTFKLTSKLVLQNKALITYSFYKAFLAEADLPTPETIKRAPALRQGDLPKLSAPWFTKGFDSTSQLAVVINSSLDKEDSESTWTWYYMPLADLTPQKLEIRLQFLGAQNEVIREQKWPLGPNIPGFIYGSRPFLHPKTTMIETGVQLVISPHFLYGSYVTPRILLDRTLVLSLKKLADVRTIRCTIEER